MLEILSFISLILLVKFAFVVLTCLPRLSVSKFLWFVVSLLLKFQFSGLEPFPLPVWLFLSWYSCLYLRYLLISSKFLFFFFLISLKELFLSSLRASITFLGFFSCASAELKCSGLAVGGALGSGGAIFPFLLLNVFLHWCLYTCSSNCWGLYLCLCGLLELERVWAQEGWPASWVWVAEWILQEQNLMGSIGGIHLSSRSFTYLLAFGDSTRAVVFHQIPKRHPASKVHIIYHSPNNV